MAPETNKFKSKVILKNVEQFIQKGDREAPLLRLIAISSTASVVMFIITYFSIQFTKLTVGGLIVNASIFALLFFLVLLILRYLGTLGASFLFISKYTAESPLDFTPFISIIVPAYNEALVIEDSIKPLLNLNYPKYEIIIVNDGSTDGTISVAEQLVGLHEGKFSPVKVTLINKQNGGKATALNAGIQFSNAEYVLCVDGDSILSENTLKNGMRHFANPKIGAVAGNVKVLNRKQMLTDLQALEYVEGLNMVRAAQSFLKIVNIIPGPVGFFRKRAIVEAGWYASDTFAEDADLTMKVRLAGWQIVYEPNAMAYTEAPESINQLLKQRYRWTRGFLQSLKKHRHFLFAPSKGIRNCVVLWSMFYDAIIWPNMNIFANLFFIVIAVFYGMSNLIPLWWISIALLDIMAALYCVSIDKEDLRLVPYAFIYRLFFVLTIDITKVAATVEEFLGMEMNWGKLERVGLSSN